MAISAVKHGIFFRIHHLWPFMWPTPVMIQDQSITNLEPYVQLWFKLFHLIQTVSLSEWIMKTLFQNLGRNFVTPYHHQQHISQVLHK